VVENGTAYLNVFTAKPKLSSDLELVPNSSMEVDKRPPLGKQQVKPVGRYIPEDVDILGWGDHVEDETESCESGHLFLVVTSSLVTYPW
jgi:hypothetical protein